MKNLYKIEQEIDKIMASLDDIEQAKSRPFFYTRLEAKMQQRYIPSTKIVLRPAFVWSFLALILVLNVGVMIHYSQKNNTSKGQNASTFAQEYGLQIDTNL